MFPCAHPVQKLFEKVSELSENFETGFNPQWFRINFSFEQFSDLQSSAIRSMFVIVLGVRLVIR